MRRARDAAPARPCSTARAAEPTWSARHRPARRPASASCSRSQLALAAFKSRAGRRSPASSSAASTPTATTTATRSRQLLKLLGGIDFLLAEAERAGHRRQPVRGRDLRLRPRPALQRRGRRTPARTTGRSPACSRSARASPATASIGATDDDQRSHARSIPARSRPTTAAMKLTPSSCTSRCAGSRASRTASSARATRCSARRCRSSAEPLTTEEPCVTTRTKPWLFPLRLPRSRCPRSPRPPRTAGKKGAEHGKHQGDHGHGHDHGDAKGRSRTPTASRVRTRTPRSRPRRTRAGASASSGGEQGGGRPRGELPQDRRSCARRSRRSRKSARPPTDAIKAAQNESKKQLRSAALAQKKLERSP